MTRASKALVVPLIVALFWALPRDRPNVDVASAALVDVPVVVSEAPVVVATTTTSTSSTTTSSSTTTTSSAPVPAVDVASEVEEPATAPVASSTTTIQATTTTVPPTTTEARSIELQALDRVAFDWQSVFPNWRVEFKGPRTGIRALTYPAEKRIEIFVRVDDTASSIHRVFAHELGHVIDVEFNSEDDRKRWREQRGLPSSTDWWPSAEAPDFATGAGDFAEAFAVLEAGVTTRSTVGRQPTESDLALLRELMRG